MFARFVEHSPIARFKNIENLDLGPFICLPRAGRLLVSFWDRFGVDLVLDYSAIVCLLPYACCVHMLLHRKNRHVYEKIDTAKHKILDTDRHDRT